ncbi:MAG: DNA-protecting protein DprA [Candidatus Aegiribacteria sp.]|nr:DNA-protecting protein DprA [Candidatus Aegiribacteria sp.]MBD3293978.1 DNA-protecting protein DprA [Candidatus Fermentibacteria bacterium]
MNRLLDKGLVIASWEGISRKELLKLLEHYTLEETVEILKREVPAGGPSADDMQRMADSAAKSGIRCVVYGREGYPEILETIPDPPAVLFYRGDLKGFLEMPAIAVIGSRRCTHYGRKVAAKLAGDFVRSGVSVVSGLARGIDSEAHRGAMESGGVTVAVLGNGLDVCYPPEHDRLSERILEKGVLVSEYPPGTEPARYRFPERNRLISGFSKGVVVVEAGKRSGTMITVNTALDQGRDVFAVPGEVTRALSMGTNMLLRDGAGVVITAADVLEPLGLSVEPEEKAAVYEPESELEKAILENLRDEPLHFNRLLRIVDAGSAVLQTALLKLEMAGVIEQLPGKVYSLR